MNSVALTSEPAVVIKPGRHSIQNQADRCEWVATVNLRVASPPSPETIAHTIGVCPPAPDPPGDRVYIDKPPISPQTASPEDASEPENEAQCFLSRGQRLFVRIESIFE